MTIAGSRRWLVVLVALVLTACQTQDEAPQPRYVSNGIGSDVAALPLAATGNPTSGPNLSQTEDKRYFIEFRSRYALSYGHTYVVFGRVNEAGEMVNPEVAGLHPKSEEAAPYVLGHMVPVPAETGWSDGDLEEEYRSASWRIMLSEPEYRKVVADIRKLQNSSPVWHAALYNCNAFTGDIAKSMGLRTPAIWLRPQQFITRLREMNTGSNAPIAASSSSG